MNGLEKFGKNAVFPPHVSVKEVHLIEGKHQDVFIYNIHLSS